MLTIPGILLLVLLLWWGLLYLRQDAMLFPGARLPHNRVPPLPPRTSVLYRSVPGGRVEAWFVAAPHASALHPAPLLVYAHGNGEVIDEQQYFLDHYAGLGLNVLMVEYRGFGRCAGRPSQQAIGADLRWFLAEVLQRPEVDSRRVVFYGRSLGGGVVADLCRYHQPRALMLECTFTSVADMARRYLAPPLLIKNPFHTDRVLPALHIPILIIHGSHDEIVPVSHARRLHQLAPKSELHILPGGHGGYEGAAGHDYWVIVDHFLQMHGLRPQ